MCAWRERFAFVALTLVGPTKQVWANSRMKQGWTYGPKRDDEAKNHNCLVPYAYLTEKVCSTNQHATTLVESHTLTFGCCSATRSVSTIAKPACRRFDCCSASATTLCQTAMPQGPGTHPLVRQGRMPHHSLVPLAHVSEW